jgi:CheY-like chemotaxis protein/HPt (histidine-containing phosphotransfer) domain-containing protein
LTIPVGAKLAPSSDLDHVPATDLGNEKPQTQSNLSFSGKVLVAEDVEPSQILMRSLLTKMGLHVTVVGNGKQVLEKATSESFDLILMDIQMPEMNGYEATMALRRQGHRTPIVALTANAMRGDNQKCLDAGCDDYLTKPINRLEFQRKLAQYLPSTQAASKTTADSSPTRTHTPLALGGDGVVPEPNAEIQHNKCIINWPQLLDRWGDEAFIRDAIPAYLDNTRENFRMLTEALKAGDCKSIATYAHAVKGAGRNLSTVTLADIAYRMERAGYDADIEKATLLYNDLKVEIDRVLTFLSQPDWMDKVAD